MHSAASSPSSLCYSNTHRDVPVTLVNKNIKEILPSLFTPQEKSKERKKLCHDETIVS